MVNSEKTEKCSSSSSKRRRGPWLIKKVTKKGEKVVYMQFPSEADREKNRLREKMRRKITSNIYAGIRAAGGYGLPMKCDTNLLLIALCEEAGWNVDQHGNISRKDSNGNGDAKDENVDLRLSL